MYVTTQFSIFMVNRPGVLAHILNEFASVKINVTAMTVMDSVEQGVLRVVFAEAAQAEEVLKRVNMPYNKSEVLCVNLPNKPGALAVIAEKLASHHINISYAYCTAGAKGGRTTGVLKVTDLKKAIKILQEDQRDQSKSQPLLRRPQSPRM